MKGRQMDILLLGLKIIFGLGIIVVYLPMAFIFIIAGIDNVAQIQKLSKKDTAYQIGYAIVFFIALEFFAIKFFFF